MKAKKQRAKSKTANRRNAPDNAPSLGSTSTPTAKLDLSTLLAETPERSIDSSWENLAPVGREFR